MSPSEQYRRVSRRGFLVGAGAIGLATVAVPPAIGAPRAIVANDGVRISWTKAAHGWATEAIEVRAGSSWRPMYAPAGHYTVLISESEPDPARVKHGTEGRVLTLLPVHQRRGRDGIQFEAVDAAGRLTAVWSADPQRPQALTVAITWTARRAGWYSIASPTVATVAPGDLHWGVVPGFWTSSVLAENDDDTLYRYGLGVPPTPWQADERAAPILMAAIEGAAGTLAAVADPTLARDPWPADETNQSTWQVSMALREANGALAPTVYSPVLGQNGSWLEAGESITSTFHLVADPGSWDTVSESVTRDLYDLGGYLALARNQESLSHRLNRIHDFVVSPDSGWHTWQFRGHELGAESGKLSDVGAMWMWQRLTGDPFIAEERLPQARGFKLAQQGIAEDGAFDGAALGEYFRDGEWISEIVWASREQYGADYVSPIFTTFYTMADGGNVLLFDSDDEEMRSVVERGAQRLLDWQHQDGSFDIGYERGNPETIKYPELEDLRATWYGLLVGYRLLEDDALLAAAKRGADWFIEHAVATGNLLGVCDDTRLIRDFQVIFAAQALLDLYEDTDEQRYADAAIALATQYTLHITTHPVATEEQKNFHGQEMVDWQLSQVGQVFEHAGYHGTLRGNGPITIASHAGAFVRFYELTGRRLFLDLARAGARGRDAFVGVTTGIPSYYWKYGNTGSTAFPWHGWWHIGWVMDYLLAESHLRTEGAVAFPRGFCTAKVGSHQPYGFATGEIFGQPADLRIPRNLVSTDEPSLEWVTAVAPDSSRLFVILLNESPEDVSATLRLNPRALRPGERAEWGSTSVLAGSVSTEDAGEWSTTVAGNGLVAFSVDTLFATDPDGPELRRLTVTGDESAPTVSWSFWAEVTSWIEWRVGGGDGDGDWTATAEDTGHTHSLDLDLSKVPTPATVQIRVATTRPDGGTSHSDPVDWRVHRLGPNIALGQPVEVSSVYQKRYSGENLVDGDTSTGTSRWLSAEGDETPTATITLAESTTPRLLRLYTGLQEKQIVHAWTVEAYTASGWEEVASVSENTELRCSVPLTAAEADQVRVIITGRSHDSIDVARVFEIEIFDVYEE